MSKITEVLQAEMTRLARREIKKSMASGNLGTAKLKRSIAQVQQNLDALEKKLLGEIGKLKSFSGTQALAEKPEVEQGKGRLSAGLLKKLRKRLKISQSELAKLVGVSAPAVATWEQGRATPRGENRMKIIALRSLTADEARERLQAGAKTVPNKRRNR